MISPRRPDFFIAGAPKCGTSSLAAYLAAHPEVFMAPKELHFFGSDLYPATRERSVDDYLARFTGASTRVRTGEASVWYMYSQKAAREIVEFSPDARVIVALRNPVDMVHSLHSQLVYATIESVEHFETAIRAELRSGRTVPVWSGDGVETPVRYLEAARYCRQIERFFESFGRERVKVILFDDLAADAGAVFADLCRFLQIDGAFRPRLDVVNPNKRVRSKRTAAMLRNPPELVKRAGRLVTTQRMRQRLVDGIQVLNTSYVPRPPMPRATRRELQAHFAEEVRELAGLLGRDLSHWSR